jgi:hypothetical protein
MSYGKIHSVFWEDEKIDTLSDRAALLALFLVSGPHRNAIGCFRLGLGAITDLRRFSEWGPLGVSDALLELSEMGFIVRDNRTGWTFIVNALKHDPISSRNTAVGAAKIAAAIPTNTVVYQHLKAKLEPQLKEQLKGAEGIFGYPMRAPSEQISNPSEAPSKDLRTPEPEPEPEPTPGVAPPALEGEFEEFWRVYPRKVDRGHAFKAFRTVRKAGVPLETLVKGAERYRDDPNRKPDFTKHGSTWLTGQCWLDAPAPIATSTRTLRVVPRHEARKALEDVGLNVEPDPADKPAYRDWKQKRESHLRLQGIDPRSLMQ